MKYLTYLNAGCIDICRNMLISAEKVGIDMDDFYIACLDNESYEKFSYLKNSFQYAQEELTEYQNWTFDSDSGFRKIHYYKWPIIQKIYQKHKELCWVDTDIVFLKDPSEYISGHKTFIAQNDHPGPRACGGFLVFNDSEITESLIGEMAANTTEDDQILLNHYIENSYKTNYTPLPRNLFPNGKTYYELENKDILRKYAYILHNNWMVGIETKMSKFKEEGYWYL
jgi:hypothetical protein